MLDVAEQPSEGIDREWLEQLYAVAVLEPGDTAAVIYDRVGAPDVPAIPTLRKWHYALTRTTQMFTLTPSFVPGVPVGVLPLAITRWPGYGG